MTSFLSKIVISNKFISLLYEKEHSKNNIVNIQSQCCKTLTKHELGKKNHRVDNGMVHRQIYEILFNEVGITCGSHQGIIR